MNKIAHLSVMLLCLMAVSCINYPYTEEFRKHPSPEFRITGTPTVPVRCLCYGEVHRIARRTARKARTPLSLCGGYNHTDDFTEYRDVFLGPVEWDARKELYRVDCYYTLQSRDGLKGSRHSVLYLNERQDRVRHSLVSTVPLSEGELCGILRPAFPKENRGRFRSLLPAEPLTSPVK